MCLPFPGLLPGVFSIYLILQKEKTMSHKTSSDRTPKIEKTKGTIEALIQWCSSCDHLNEGVCVSCLNQYLSESYQKGVEDARSDQADQSTAEDVWLGAYYAVLSGLSQVRLHTLSDKQKAEFPIEAVSCARQAADMCLSDFGSRFTDEDDPEVEDGPEFEGFEDRCSRDPDDSPVVTKSGFRRRKSI